MLSADRIAAALALASPSDILPGDMLEGSAEPSRAAAVLVAITDRARPGLILTTRPDTMRNHAGQVAFPGGRIDPGEPVETALDGAEHDIERRPPTLIDRVEPEPDRLGQREQDGEED